MSTSAVSTFNISRDDLVRKALRRVGVKNPSVSELQDAVSSLNYLIKKLDVAGNWLWTISTTETQLNTQVGVQTYGTGAPPIFIPADIIMLNAMAVIQGQYRYYLRIVDKFESTVTMEKDRQGMPLLAYLDKGVTMIQNKLWIYPTPTQVWNIVYTFRRRLYDFVNPADNPDFPQEWFMPLSIYLASDLADSYGLDLPERQWLNQRAVDEIKSLKAANAESVKPPLIPTQYF